MKKVGSSKKGTFLIQGKRAELEHHSGSICARACVYIYIFIYLVYVCSDPVGMDEVLKFMGHQDDGPFVILQELQDSLLHQVITEVDVQRREGIVLREEEEEEV